MASSWEKCFQHLKTSPCFDSPESVNEFYQKSFATPKKVIELMRSEPKDDAERDSFLFLKRYVRGLDENSLKKFLKFVTGTDSMFVTEIQVSFFLCDSEILRRPIAHTCGPVLELPSNYRNFCELRSDFSNILKADDWLMEIV